MYQHQVELVLPNEQTITVHCAGEGKPIVMLHGFPLDATLWLASIEPLVNQGFHVLCPDLRGFGKSGEAKEPLSIADLATDIERIRQTLVGHEPIVLVGLSLGGYVALEYWRQYRARLGKLVLCNTKPQADAQPAKQARLAMAEKALNESTWSAVAPMLGKLIAEPIRTDHGALAQQVKDMMARVPATTVATIQNAMAQRADFVPHLSQIEVPTLVITGEHDTISSPEDNRQWSADLPNARLAIISQAAHLPPLENPEEFNQVLVKFVD